MALREIQPAGHSFEAVSILKQSTDKRDKNLIYKINDRRLNGEPSSFRKESCRGGQIIFAYPAKLILRLLSSFLILFISPANGFITLGFYRDHTSSI